MVTPWAQNGTMGDYLIKYPETNRLRLLLDVALGLHYLHTMSDPIIHGDIYIDNVLVSGDGRALLNDFGLSSVTSADPAAPSAYSGDAERYMAGRTSYEAPERHWGERRSLATDVFAFAMLNFHTYAGEQPFNNLPTKQAVIMAIYDGKRPLR
ncbi:kinase-like protein, partial [Auricularia subglabra TFB-10046 SS5]